MAQREDTIRDHHERLNQVLTHIDEHLDEALNLEALAEVAYFSPFHFHRIFAAFVGERPNQYVRRVRLERAANRLVHTELAVTEIALCAGYETPGAFNKAFKRHFGVNPTRFRRKRRAELIPAALAGYAHARPGGLHATDDSNHGEQTGHVRAADGNLPEGRLPRVEQTVPVCLPLPPGRAGRGVHRHRPR